MRFILLCLTLLLSACTSKPEGVIPVNNFELERYLGKWYEIARLDHSFERGLSQITAEYSLRDDGGVKVMNRGYSAEKKDWKEAQGKAYFVADEDIAHLKVSFFGPFYGSYIVFELDRNDYQYALVSGPDTSYLWILARQPELDKETLDYLIDRAAAAGFATEQLIFVDH